VDGGKPITVNAYNAATVWQRTYSSALYSDTNVHTVTITTPPGTKYVDVDAIQIVAPATALSAGTYDDTDPAWVYTGNWTTPTYTTGPVNNTLHLSNASNATATFTFQGPARFVLTYTAASNRGLIQVSVDGGKPVTINAYSAKTVWKKLYTSPLYAGTGIHTVTIFTPVNGKFVDVDAIKIQP
jgi:hypothetical protein